MAMARKWSAANEEADVLTLELCIQASDDVAVVLHVKTQPAAEVAPKEEEEEVAVAPPRASRASERGILCGFAPLSHDLGQPESIESRVLAQNDAKDREMRVRAKWQELSTLQAAAVTAPRRGAAPSEAGDEEELALDVGLFLDQVVSNVLSASTSVASRRSEQEWEVL